MSCRTFARPAPLLLKNPEIPDVPVHPVPGTVLKIPGAPDQRAILTDNQAKMRSLIILDKDIPVLCGNGFGLFAGKRTVRMAVFWLGGLETKKFQPAIDKKIGRGIIWEKVVC